MYIIVGTLCTPLLMISSHRIFRDLNFHFWCLNIAECRDLLHLQRFNLSWILTSFTFSECIIEIPNSNAGLHIFKNANITFISVTVNSHKYEKTLQIDSATTKFLSISMNEVSNHTKMQVTLLGRTPTHAQTNLYHIDGSKTVQFRMNSMSGRLKRTILWMLTEIIISHDVGLHISSLPHCRTPCSP